MKRDIESDPEIQKYATSIVLQSRLKTAPSAFKKMVKGAKQRDELFDLLGLRIIITERDDDSDGYGRSHNHPDEDTEEDDQVRVHVDIAEDEVVSSSSTTSQQEDDEDTLNQQQLVPSSAKLFREKQAIYRMEVLLNR